MGEELKCERCDVEMVEGKVLIELYSGHPDFIGGKVEDIVTVSPSGVSRLSDCLKCPQCGYSVSIG